MKVKEMIKKYKMSGNATVFVQHGITGDLVELTQSELRNAEPEFIMGMKLNTFDITDNVLTLYVE